MAEYEGLDYHHHKRESVTQFFLILASLTHGVHRMTTEGIYYFTAQATGPDGNTYQSSVAVTVMNKNTLDSLLKQKWEGMKGALLGGQKETALTYFTQASQERYRSKFTALTQEQINLIFSSLVDLRMESTNGQTAECGAIRQEAGGIYSYPVTFVISDFGLWTIAGF